MRNEIFQRLVLRELKNIKVESSKMNAKLEVIDSRISDNLGQQQQIEEEKGFLQKIILALGFAAVIYAWYIVPLRYILPWLETLSANNDFIINIGMIIIVLTLVIITTVMVHWRRKDIPEYEGYFRWLSDIVTVLMLIVIMYKTYYVPHINQVAYDEGLLKKILLIFLSNEGLLGFPFVILLIRAVIGAYRLVSKENDTASNEVKS